MLIDINNDYTLSDVILGTGATGKIIEATDKFDKKYAIKIINKSILEDNPNHLIALQKEIEINYDIKHPNIVKCYNIYETKNDIYFVLEKISGKSLLEYMETFPNCQVPEKYVIIILKTLMEILVYLHEKKHIIHRDIKLENILIINKNKNDIPQIKLIDFGFASYIPKNGLFMKGLGTPNYIAPEIYLNKPYNIKVDIWSSGVVLYNLITGKQLFMNSNNIEDIQNDVINKECDYKCISNPYLRIICMNMLNRDPQKRYSASEVLNKLNNYNNCENLNESIQTEVNNFQPFIDEKIFKYDVDLEKELENLLLENLNIIDIIQLSKYIKKKYINSITMNETEIIMEILKYNDLPDNVKNKLFNFSQKYDVYFLNNLKIDLLNFIDTITNKKKYIETKKVYYIFMKYDINNKGIINVKDIYNIFNVRQNPTFPRLSKFEKIDFNKFLRLWNKYYY